jgi:hypothetical protein
LYQKLFPYDSNVSVLIGSTGFVGGHIRGHQPFDLQVHRPDVGRIRDLRTDLLVCAGLPAEKWRANNSPDEDFENVCTLAELLCSTRAEQAVLVSTVDVFQPATNVSEETPPNFNGPSAYGRHRAWFEAFFRSQFPDSLIVRLPGLFASDVRKNLIHDLLHNKQDQYASVNPASTFQFFNANYTWQVISTGLEARLKVLNVASEPVLAQEVADLFGKNLEGTAPEVHYDMRSIHADRFGGKDGYQFERTSILAGISALRSEFTSS